MVQYEIRTRAQERGCGGSAGFSSRVSVLTYSVQSSANGSTTQKTPLLVETSLVETDLPSSLSSPRVSGAHCAYNSGYLKRHGLKVLTVVFPNGIIAYLYGPVSTRENNIALLNMSWLNEPLVALQPENAAARANGEQILFFSLYGDKIFPDLQCITHAHEAPLEASYHQVNGSR
jgi:hypothetical protein